MELFKILFMGTPDFAVPCLERLIAEGHDIRGVVTQPDRKRGRGGKVTHSPVKKVAVKYGLRVFQPERIRNPGFTEELKNLGAELFITCAYGQILPQAVLDVPVLGCINVHASLLPEYRGAAPIQRALMNGDETTGITTMMTDRGMDTGDILIKHKVSIGGDMTSGELHDILKTAGADVLTATLQKLGEGSLVRIPQDDNLATYAPMLKKEESLVDWRKDAKSIHDKVRALNPWPGCFTSYKGKRMRIIRTGVEYIDSVVVPGGIISVDKEKVKTACGAGVLDIFELQFENSRRMSVSQCWHNIDKNAVLGQENE